MTLATGSPGDYFVCQGEFGQWAIWKLLDGDDLALARELGYKSEKVAACVLVGRRDQPPYNPRGMGEAPYGMCDPRQVTPLHSVKWVKLP